MPVKIRLARIGKKQMPFYRVVAIDSRAKRNGECLANIGTYDALNSVVVTFNAELYEGWIAKGAQPTDTAKKIYKIYKKTAPAAAASSESSAKTLDA